MSHDTRLGASALQHRIFRQMRGEEKVRMAMGFSDFVRNLALSGLKSRYPGSTETERLILFIREVHGVDLSSVSEEKSP